MSIKQPSIEDIRAARKRAGHTQTEAAETIHAPLRTWQNWESHTNNYRPIDLAAWELYLIKTGQIGPWSEQ